MDEKKRRILTVKHVSYTGIILLCYILGATPGLFRLFGAAPNLMIPLVTVIAMYEGEFAGGMYGALCGLLWDSGAFTLFGLGGMFFLLAGVVIGLLVIYLLQNSLKNAFTLTAATALLHGVMTYSFLYGMWGYEGSYLILLNKTLPSVLYTTLLTWPAYLGLGRIHNRFKELAED